MVLDEKTLLPLHEMTRQGRIEYNRYLTFEADKMIYFSTHPIDAIIYRLSRIFDWEDTENRILDKIPSETI